MNNCHLALQLILSKWMTVPFTILHIPHASLLIPEEECKSIALDSEALNKELLKMTDRYTDELFHIDNSRVTEVIFPVSRLIVDPERFPDDKDEPMAKRGMGAVYTKTSDGQQLRKVSFDYSERKNLLEKYYFPHHRRLEHLVEQALERTSRALVIDCHSFPSHALLCDLDQSSNRPEICLGTDEFHSPPALVSLAKDCWKKACFSVEIDRPYAGAIVPLKYYQKDKRVQALMVEIRRDLYMNEKTGLRNESFKEVHKIIHRFIVELLDAF